MSEEAPKKPKRGRPPLPEGMMKDVTLRVTTEILEEGQALADRAGSWPEFKRTLPNRSAVLRLAMTYGLEMLAKRPIVDWMPEPGKPAIRHPGARTPEVDDLREMILSLKRDVDMVNKMEELRKVVLALQKDIESLKQKGSE